MSQISRNKISSFSPLKREEYVQKCDIGIAFSCFLLQKMDHSIIGDKMDDIVKIQSRISTIRPNLYQFHRDGALRFSTLGNSLN
jgi:hypothetical protein